MSRRQKLLAEVEKVKKYFENDETIQNMVLDDEVLSFEYMDSEFSQAFTLDLSAFPGQCTLLGQDRVFTEPLKEVVKTLVDELFADGADYDPYGEGGEGGEGEGGEGDYGGGDDYTDYDTGHPLYGTSEDRYKENKILMQDVNNFQTLFGETSVRMKAMPVLEIVEAQLSLPPLDVVNASTASAWGIDPTLPIVFKVPVSDMYYLEATKPPKIEVWQMDNEFKKKFGLKAQLEGILETFVSAHWPSKSGRKIESKPMQKLSGSGTIKKDAKGQQPQQNKPQPQPQQQQQQQKNKSDGGILGKLINTFTGGSKNSSSSSSSSSSLHPHVDIQALQQLTSMGFSEDICLNALLICNGNVESASTLILEHPEQCTEEAARAASKEEKKEPAKKMLGNMESAPRVDELFKTPSKALKSVSDEEKLYVAPDYGFLVMVMAYARRRIPTLNDYCVICDRPHVFATGSMLKPAVCSRELCCWSFQQLGVGSESADDIATEAEVVDLLVCMATVAVKSQRKELIFDPFPLVFDPDNPKVKAIDPQNKDFNQVIMLLSKMPSIESMTQASDFVSMKETMDKAHRLCFPLMQWIITSNRSHIVQLTDGKHIKSMQTKHQYLLLSAPPEKEERFRELKKTNTSTWAYHGSSIENWHSILRKGLVNASGTKLQVNGAAYGSGIYLSPHAGTSFGYSRMYNYNYNYNNANNPNAPKVGNAPGGNRFLKTDNVFCIAICEVIDKDIRKSGSIWVQPHEDHVVTRFFCVYTDGNPGNAINCSTENAAFRAEIEEAINFYQAARQ